MGSNRVNLQGVELVEMRGKTSTGKGGKCCKRYSDGGRKTTLRSRKPIFPDQGCLRYGNPLMGVSAMVSLFHHRGLTVEYRHFSHSFHLFSSSIFRIHPRQTISCNHAINEFERDLEFSHLARSFSPLRVCFAYFVIQFEIGKFVFMVLEMI